MIAPLHSWEVTPSEAVALQQQLRYLVRLTPLTQPVETIAGADISFNKYSEKIYTGIVVLRVSDLQIVDEVGLQSIGRFPYVPGLLSFREAPSLLEAWDKLTIKPDAVMLDGHGIAHPRRLGIASHFGLWVDRPAFGCGKSILVGQFADLPETAGSRVPLVHRGEEIGCALRTKHRVAPIFVSPGHRITLDEAVALTLQTTTKYRQPEPTRQAHLLVNRLRVADKSS